MHSTFSRVACAASRVRCTSPSAFISLPPTSDALPRIVPDSLSSKAALLCELENSSARIFIIKLPFCLAHHLETDQAQTSPRNNSLAPKPPLYPFHHGHTLWPKKIFLQAGAADLLACVQPVQV